jgi:hypothetical protein
MWKNVVQPDRPEIFSIQHFMLDTKGCKHAPRMCNTYRFSTETVVDRTRLNMYYVMRTLPVLLTLI